MRIEVAKKKHQNNFDENENEKDRLTGLSGKKTNGKSLVEKIKGVSIILKIVVTLLMIHGIVTPIIVAKMSVVRTTQV